MSKNISAATSIYRKISEATVPISTEEEAALVVVLCARDPIAPARVPATANIKIVNAILFIIFT
jgi:hypothetical protein